MEQHLTKEERQKFWAALDQMNEANEKIDRIYVLLAGDKTLHQEGLIERIIKLEEKVDGMERQIDKAKGWLGGALAVGSVFGSIVTLGIKYLISKL
jgi:hypothetical protein